MANVVVRFTIEVVMEFGDQYAVRDHVNFALNEGSWCADNLAEHLAAWTARREEMEDRDGITTQPLGGCLCDATTAEFIRIATADDLRKLPVLDEPLDRQVNDIDAA